MDLLLQVHYKEKNNPDVEISRFIIILLNTLTQKEYTKLRILFYILSIISIIALIYFMWIMNNIIISIVVIIGICVIAPKVSIPHIVTSPPYLVSV